MDKTPYYYARLKKILSDYGADYKSKRQIVNEVPVRLGAAKIANRQPLLRSDKVFAVLNGRGETRTLLALRAFLLTETGEDFLNTEKNV